MSRKTRFNNIRENDSEYNKGYLDGMQASFDSSELDAYYAGVGYGKAIAKNKHLGFNSEEERLEFEKGMRNKNNHFHVYRAKKPGFFERIFFPGALEKEKRKTRIKERRDQRAKKRNEKKTVKRRNRYNRPGRSRSSDNFSKALPRASRSSIISRSQNRKKKRY